MFMMRAGRAHWAKRAWTFVAVAFLLASCMPLIDPKPEFQFSDSVRKLGLNPVYPPREDFSVGDVFIVGEYDDPQLRQPRAYLGSSEYVLDLARAALRRPVAFKGTTVDNSGRLKPGGEDLVGPRLSRRGELSGADALKSLPLVAFPSMTLDAGTAASAGLARPLGLFGGFFSRRTTVTLNFNDTRSYGTTPVWEFKQIRNDVKQLLARYGGCDPARAYLRRLTSAQNNAEPPVGRIFVVTRVYLTRKIDYTYRDAKIIALAEKAIAAQGAGGSSPQPVFNNTTIVSNGTPATADSGAGAGAAALPAVQSDGFQFVGLSGLGLTLSREFERPLAVGYEGLVFEPTDVGCEPLLAQVNPQSQQPP